MMANSYHVLILSTLAIMMQCSIRYIIVLAIIINPGVELIDIIYGMKITITIIMASTVASRYSYR